MQCELLTNMDCSPQARNKGDQPCEPSIAWGEQLAVLEHDDAAVDGGRAVVVAISNVPVRPVAGGNGLIPSALLGATESKPDENTPTCFDRFKARALLPPRHFVLDAARLLPAPL